jgi:hypothetical protein
MGAFGVLGHVASGFEEARQKDLARQFEDVQNRRALHMQLLSKLASDETVHPDVRNWAIQNAMLGSQTPLTGKWEPKWKEMPAPKPPATQSYTQQPIAPPPQGQQPTMEGIRPLPPPPGAEQQTAQFTPPNDYAGAFLTHEARARHMAEQTGAVAGATAGATTQAQIAAHQQALNNLIKAHPELADDPNFKAVMPFLATGMQVPYMVGRGMLQGRSITQTVADAKQDPRWAPLIPKGLPDSAFVQLQMNQRGDPQTVNQTVPPAAYLPHLQNGFQLVTDESGNQNLIPIQRSSQVVMPGQGAPASGLTPPPGQAAPAQAPKAGAHVGKGIKVGHKPGTTMIAPPTEAGGQPQVIAAVPGGTIPQGAVTPSGYSTSQVPTSPVRTRAQMSTAQLKQIDVLEREIPKQADQLGPFIGRFNAFLQGRVGSGDPDYAYLKGKVDLMQTAMMMIHAGGRPAFGLMKKFEDNLSAGKMDAPTLLGGLKAIKEQMQTYAQEGELWGFRDNKFVPQKPIKMTSPNGKESVMVDPKDYEHYLALGAKVAD